MAVSAGTVTIDFVSEVAKFNAQLKSVQNSLKRLETDFASLERVAGVALRVFSGAAILSFAKSVFNAADQLSDAAKRAGIAVESFSRLQFAAQQSDVEFSELTLGIKNFQTNLAEARTGVESASRTFGLLGLEASKIGKLQLEEQLAEIADAFQNIVDPADRTRIAVELFGRNGQSLIPLLAQGAEGIRELTAEADRLGITMSETTAKGIDQADAAIKRLKSTVLAGGSKFLAGLSIALLGPPEEVQRIDKQIEELRRTRDLVLIRVPDTSLRKKRIDELNAQIDVLIAKQKELLGLQDIPNLPKMDFEPQDISISAPNIKELNEAIAEEQKKREEAAFDARIHAVHNEMILVKDQLEFEQDLRADIEKAITGDMARENEERLRQSAEAEEARFELVLKSEQVLQDARQAAFNAGVGLLRSMAGKSKAAAIALIAVNRGLQIAQAIQNTLAGATLQLTTGDPYTAVARAMAVKVWGFAQVALIAATGFSEARNAAAGGGLPLGSPHNPIFTNTQQGDQPTFGASSQNAVQVIIANNVGWDQSVIDKMLAAIREAVDDRDVIIFGLDSLQAQQIVPA